MAKPVQIWNYRLPGSPIEEGLQRDLHRAQQAWRGEDLRLAFTRCQRRDSLGEVSTVGYQGSQPLLH